MTSLGGLSLEALQICSSFPFFWCLFQVFGLGLGFASTPAEPWRWFWHSGLSQNLAGWFVRDGQSCSCWSPHAWQWPVELFVCLSLDVLCPCPWKGLAGGVRRGAESRQRDGGKRFQLLLLATSKTFLRDAPCSPCAEQDEEEF